MLNYDFMLNALVAGIAISLCAALVGVTLVLRRNAMISDGLSHTAFASFALATAFGFAPLYFSLPIVILSSYFILHLSRSPRFRGDSAIAVLSASSLALGTAATSLSSGINIDFYNYLFGSVLAISQTELIFSLVLVALVLLFYIFAYHHIFAITFDQDFAKSIGLNTNLYDTIFAIICSIVIVLGMRLLGALLISSLVVFPTVTAMRFAKTFRGVVLSSTIISVVCFILGLTASFYLATPAGASVVIANLLAFSLASLYNSLNH